MQASTDSSFECFQHLMRSAFGRFRKFPMYGKGQLNRRGFKISGLMLGMPQAGPLAATARHLFAWVPSGRRWRTAHHAAEILDPRQSVPGHLGENDWCPPKPEKLGGEAASEGRRRTREVERVGIWEGADEAFVERILATDTCNDGCGRAAHLHP